MGTLLTSINPNMFYAVALLAMVFVMGWFFRKNKNAFEFIGRKQIAAPVMAKAIVLSINQTGMYKNHRPQVTIQLQVMPPKGRNFVVEIKEIVSLTELALLQHGSAVQVQYNPHDVKEVALIKAITS